MDYRIKIKFKGPLHIGLMDGVSEVSDIIIHAETIFGALMNAHSKLFGERETEELIKKLMTNSEKTDLRFSSAFYYIGDTYFLPRPKGEDFGLLPRLTQPKKLKKVKYVQEEIVFGSAKANVDDVHGQFLSKKKIEYQGEFNSPAIVIERPRVMINRLNSSSNLYYFSEVHFAPNCGLWFYLSVGQEIEKQILAALRLLADEGIGGDRTYGFGHFDYEIQPIELPKEGDRYLLLSPYIPSPEDYKESTSELAKEVIKSYELMYRTGYIHNSDKKAKRVIMFTEGSVFNKRVDGRILDISPEGFEEENNYKVYRYGKAFLLPFKGGSQP
ncbi:CRISPR-associated protein, Csm4 family [Fervidobacterium changbaicum]|uniref:CRISPR system Cms protein Csm4 n=1 Tax=Fervidobacterium changbaicum TaxID=310769 RepID=A0AAE6CDM0_9BACT|nr:type III-A CRISPR-associated RAMP protein Csm4 [Fervidobacterium changbaicum]QAV33188.1 type III-A CRISPR-associated RAMP protein Csm4 [Fervidobacterium changbaicum]SDH70634.1 CRISPR-associated protein, Csm4 family [Fervidobacterium changbaicum]